MANSNNPTIDQSTEERQLGTEAEHDKLTVTKENVDLVCKASVAAGIRVTFSLLRHQFDTPTSGKLRFLIADWKEQNGNIPVLTKGQLQGLVETQADEIAQLKERIQELEEELEETKDQDYED